MYEILADNYDSIFPMSKEALDFSVTNCKKGKLLDIGCGTGELARSLSENGFIVSGIDLDESMIKRAKERGESEKLNYNQLNMLSIGDNYKKEQFDNILCLGNTMVHLQNIQEIMQFLKSVYNILKKGGKFIIQILNYHYILNNNITDLPPIHSEHFDFFRTYKIRHDDKLDFNVKLVLGNNEYVGTSILLPLKPDTAKSLINSTGFKISNLYGSFSKASFDKESSFLFIVECIK